MKRFGLALIVLLALAFTIGQGMELVATVLDAPAAARNVSLVPGGIERISVDTSGGDPDDASGHVSISSDGCLVAYSSPASDLIGNDHNDDLDVFVRNRCTGATERVSVDTAEQEAGGSSWEPSLSSDGRYVAFSSSAPDLVAGDTNGVTDVFLRDRTSGVTTRLSLSSSGIEGNGLSLHPAISADGLYVAFVSEATNLVSGDTNGVKDIFVRHRVAGTTQRISVNWQGLQVAGLSDNPAISGDGCYVAFESVATNLVSGDTNNVVDVFVRNRCAGKGAIERVSVSSSGAQGDEESYDTAISADGCYVAFESAATTLTGSAGFKHVYVRNRCAIPPTTVRVSVDNAGNSGNSNSGDPSITVIDGCYIVAFESWAGNLDFANSENVGIPDFDIDGDIFVRDLCNNTTERITIHGDNQVLYGREDSADPAISNDGLFVAFKSRTADLVINDTNGEADVFVWEQ